MPTVKREDISEVSAVITVDINKNDYQQQVKKKLRDLQQQTSIKGFRPGQAPLNFISKRFGTGIVSEVVEEQVRQALGNFLRDEKLTIVAQPLPQEGNNYRYNIDKLEDYVFKFDIGIVPEFEIKGTDLDNVLPFYDITIDEEFLQTEIDRLRERFSDGFETEVAAIEEKDMIFATLEELDENGEVKAKGIKQEGTPFMVAYLNEEVRKQMVGAAVGASFDVNIYTLEPQRTKDFINKHVLKVSPKVVFGEQFRLTVERVQRPKKAELSEDFYKRLFPTEEVNSADAFQEKMRDELYKVYKQLSMQRFFATIYNSLMEKNDITLPVDFLKKFLSVTEQNLPEGFFESEQFTGIQNDIRWGLMRDRLAAKFEIEITREEVEDTVRLEILKYFNYQIAPYSDYVNQQIARILADQREFQKRYEATLDERVLEQLSEMVGKGLKTVSKAEFDALDKVGAPVSA